MKRILIAGAGALGSLLAARLAGNGRAVTLLARGGRLREISALGICCDDDSPVFVPAIAGCDNLPVQDLVIVATKTDDLAPVLESVASAVGPGTVFLTLQNGVDAPDLVVRRHPSATVLAARVHGFFELREGIVHHAGVEPSIRFGGISGAHERAGAALAWLLDTAGLANSQSPAIIHDLWEKLVLAAAIGAVGSALALPAGQLCSTQLGREMLAGSMSEIACIAARKGIVLSEDCVAATLGLIAAFPPDVTSSLQRDLEAGRPSEYDALPGAVLRMACETGSPAPVLEQCDAMIRARGLL